MITIKLSGGLGNQLFQYAYGYQMAKKLNTGIILDTSWFDRQHLRRPDILKFRIKYESARRIWDTDSKIKLLNKTFINRSLRILGCSSFRAGEYNYFKETRYKYAHNIKTYAKDQSYLDGYWQCPEYFASVREDLIQMYCSDRLSPGVKELGNYLKEINSVAVHVRRGDYPAKKQLISRLVAISDEYYKKALEAVLPKIGCDPEIYVFSNNMPDARDMLNPMISGLIRETKIKTTAIDEWHLMKCCRNQIIGNSTFSWWPAYLNDCKNKIVAAPNRYMGNDDILDKGWIAVDI